MLGCCRLFSSGRLVLTSSRSASPCLAARCMLAPLRPPTYETQLRRAKPGYPGQVLGQRASILVCKSLQDVDRALPSKELSPSEGDSASPILVVVDTLNYLEYFFPRLHAPDKSNKDPWGFLSSMLRRVRGLMEAAKESQMELMFVIDAGWSSSEASGKWKRRREQEVKKREKRVLPGTDILLVEALEAAGAKVFTPQGQDADDIMVLLAHNMGPDCFILSQDSDLYRYGLPNACNRIKDTLIFENTCRTQNIAGVAQPVYDLVLQNNRGGEPRKGIRRRSLKGLSESIAYEPESWLVREVGISHAVQEQVYIRGTCSSYVKRFGNLHGHLKPLRQAVYKQLGIHHDVREVYPEWDHHNGAVIWIDEMVSPSIKAIPEELARAMASGYEDFGFEAIRWLEGVDPSSGSESQDSLERQFARYSLAAELVCTLYPDLGASQAIQLLSGKEVVESTSVMDWPPFEWMEMKCVEERCGMVFNLNVPQRIWFTSRGLALPKRCPECRERRRTRKPQKQQQRQ